MIENNRNMIREKALKITRKNLLRSSFFISYPFWIFIQNISFYFTLLYMFSLRRVDGVRLFRVNSFLSFNAIILVLGAAASTVGAGINQGKDFFMNSIIILPNYLYWGVLIIILGNTALKISGLLAIYKVFFWGLISSIITYYFLSPLLSGIPIFRSVTPNNFSFILILFSPVATAYLHYTYRNTFFTSILIIIITLAGFLSGSRSGSILALTGAFVTLSLNSWLRMILTIFTGIFILIAAPQVIESPSVKASIKNLNERTYDLIYSTDETLTTDRSYLTRLAMIEKGLNIFEEHPIEGVGVNNFTKVAGEIDFNFEGAEYIEGKEEILSEGISAHNSYISFLAEGGLLLFIPMILMILFPLFYFIFNFNNIIGYEKAIFISILFMAIHSWFISGLLNVFAWFVLGIANSYIIHKKQHKVK
jgi:hypothetical protein